ncbi:MAG: hypothetical protein ACO1QB_14525 [Verrucomicrobiales bacterium]
MNYHAQHRPTSLLLGLCFAILCVSGCGNDPAPEPVAPAKTTKSGLTAAGSDLVIDATNSPPRSVFTIGKGARDPFSSQATQEPDPATGGSAAAPQVQQPADIAALLEEGLQWVVGSGNDRLALLNNVMLEPNKTAQIPLTLQGRRQVVTVRCLGIQRNTVTLLIAGQSNPVTITQIPKK